MTRRAAVLTAVLFGVAAAAQAQNFTYQYRTSANSTLTTVTSGSDITAPPTGLGLTSTVTLVITNSGTGTWTLTQDTISGAAYKITQDPAGTAIPPGSATTLTFSFTPATTGANSGALSFVLTANGQSVPQNFLLTGTGQQPNFITSYILQPNGNQVAISSGGTITFPATNTNSTATASFIIANNGTGPGVVNSVTASGAAFLISGLTLLPATVQPNSNITFTISFTPTARGAASGTLTIAFAGSAPITINLAGTGTGASLTYTATLGSQSSPLAAGATLTLPATNLGASYTAAITVINSGDANATVGGLSVVGAGFSIANAPPTPATLVPGGSLVFNLVFQPQAAGPATGTLLIGSVSFPLSGTGVGASLQYASVIGPATTPLANSGTVVFPNTNVGSTTTIAIQITNTGNATATISGISVSGTGFSLPGLPQLPLTIKAGASVQFNVAFQATSTAAVTGTLQIDSFAVNLRGNGNPPPAVSAVSFSNLPATANPLDQPSVGLTLAQPYPMDLSGTLTLTFASGSFADDPNIQFSTGGRTVNFTIPANTTTALFNGSNKVQFQAGTVAGTITFTASLSVASVPVTPNPAPSAQVVINPAAPVLRTVQIGTTTATSFEVLITGLSTARDVSQITLQFTPAPNANLQTTTLTINSEASFSTWYQSQTGISFGSQFTASVIVNVSGAANAVQSVSVTAANSHGTSNAVSVNLQ